MKKNDYSGICLIVGSGSVNRHFSIELIKNEVPDAKIIEDPTCDIKNLLEAVENCVLSHKESNYNYIISTGNPLVFYSIYCYCRLNDCTDSLKVYCLEKEPDIRKCVNDVNEPMTIWKDTFTKLKKAIDSYAVWDCEE